MWGLVGGGGSGFIVGEVGVRAGLIQVEEGGGRCEVGLLLLRMEMM